MRRNDRILFALLFGIPALLVIPVALIGWTLWTPGTIRCDVLDKTDGTAIGITVPAGIVPVAARCAPAVMIDDVRCKLDGEARQALALARVALAELRRTPDGVLVDVRTESEVVLIEKVDGELRIDVDTPEERVRVSVPLPVVSSVLGVI